MVQKVPLVVQNAPNAPSVFTDFQVTQSNGQFSDLIFQAFSVASDTLQTSPPPLLFPFSSTLLLKPASDSFSYPLHHWFSKSH